MRGAVRGPLAVLLVCLVALGIAAVLLGRTPPSDTDPSSRSTGDAGTQALYEWLTRLGLQTQRMSGDFAPSTADVLVVAEPTVAFTAGDARATAQMVRGGGELILALDRTAGQAAASLLGALDVQPTIDSLLGRNRPIGLMHATPAAPIDPAGLVRSVPVQPGVEFDTSAGGPPVPLLVVGGRVVGLAIPVGQGLAYVIGSPYPLSNVGLRDGDSALLALSLIDRARGGRIAFDEVHHGETATGGASAVLAGPVGLAGGLAALAILAYLALSGRRLGRALPGSDPSRVPSATEYVEAMGALFERTPQRGGVAARYAEELKQRVGTAAGIDPHGDDDAFLGALDGFDPVRAVAVRAALARCRELAGGRPGDAQLVALARQVDEAEAGFAVGAGVGLASSPR
ncbi:MAG TPA: DUF4350 domain-containing protein [Candidatus Dormibacteraeota bacterium]|jgi:hypothetical protein|nr:DUF4350 domain-containing protein [Candidatus Dormibacteraeota bacterium]